MRTAVFSAQALEQRRQTLLVHALEFVAAQIGQDTITLEVKASGLVLSGVALLLCVKDCQGQWHFWWVMHLCGRSYGEPCGELRELCSQWNRDGVQEIDVLECHTQAHRVTVRLIGKLLGTNRPQQKVRQVELRCPDFATE